MLTAVALRRPTQGAVAGALGSIFAATVVPSHAPVYRAKAAGVGMVAGGLVGVLVELTTPPERRGDAYLEASRVRPYVSKGPGFYRVSQFES
jgi:hypothetical protein